MNCIASEEWRPVVGFEGQYEISSHGRVRGLDRFISDGRGNRKWIKGTAQPMQQYGAGPGWRDGKHYWYARFKLGGKARVFVIHRMVAKAFVPNPENLPEVNHIDGNRVNNHYSNLEWCTHQQNMQHAVRLGLLDNAGEAHPMSKLTTSDVLQIRQLIRGGQRASAIALQFNVHPVTIRKISRRAAWKHLP